MDVLSNGLTVKRNYDAAGQTIFLSNEYADGEPLSRFEISYNPTGTISEILKTFVRPNQSSPGQYVLKYNYDELDRLVYASTDGQFSYDIMGNHTNRSQVHNNLNQLLEDADYTYEYTVNGDLQKKISRRTGEQTEYVWNSEGKISGITVKRSDGTIKSVIENKYDALGRRIARIANSEEVRYVYDGEHIIAEIGANDSVRAVYLHSLEVDEPLAMVRDMNGNGEFEGNELFFFSKDHLNSVHDLTDFEGKPVQRYNYTAYGQTKIEKTGAFPSESFVQNPFGYTSREWEQETGDYYYRARFYDPRTGRFLSEDPIGFLAGDANYYRYVLNNPILYSDPSGNNPYAVAGAVAGAIIGGWTSGSQSSANCFLGKAADALAGAATGAAGGFFLGFGIPTPGLIGAAAVSIGGSVAGLGPAAIGIFGNFGSSLCNPPPPSCPTER